MPRSMCVMARSRSPTFSTARDSSAQPPTSCAAGPSRRTGRGASGCRTKKEVVHSRRVEPLAGNTGERCSNRRQERCRSVQLHSALDLVFRGSGRLPSTPPYSKTGMASCTKNRHPKVPKIDSKQESLAEWTGLEPATPGVTGRYSNQLNYHSAWRQDSRIAPQALPNLASPRGFEPL